MIYCDTSFILALYVEGGFFHLPASRLAAKFKEPIPLTLLSELELVNGIRRSLAAKIIGIEEHDRIFRQMAEDESQGILVRLAIHQPIILPRRGNCPKNSPRKSRPAAWIFCTSPPRCSLSRRATGAALAAADGG